MKNILIITPDVIDERMAGPGIRHWEIARALSRHWSVTLAAPNVPKLDCQSIRIVSYDKSGDTLRSHGAVADAIIAQGFIFSSFPFLRKANKPLVVDLYDPFQLENLETNRYHDLRHQFKVHSRDLVALLEQLQAGDYFICANERQRSYWLGMLSAIGKIRTNRREPSDGLEKLISVVSFGIPSAKPVHSKRVLKGVFPGIGTRDRVIIWGGGVWAWLDPLLLIKAMPRVTESHPNAKVLFMGKGHPNGAVLAIQGLSLEDQAMALARRLGLLGKSVFFNSEWVKYEERQNYLLEADIGISLHQDSIETRYAARTRLLDYVWCGLPAVVSAGDMWGELVAEKKLGKVVPIGDPDSLAAALCELLSEPELKDAYAPAFEAIRQSLTWDRVIEPLVSFLKNPRNNGQTMASDR